jgi:hypothetical protein
MRWRRENAPNTVRDRQAAHRGLGDSLFGMSLINTPLFSRCSSSNPLPPFYSFPHSLDVLIYLDHVNEENGLLYVLPSSHRRFDIDIKESDFDDKPGQVAVHLTPGSAVFLHNHLWHRATSTTPQGTIRRMLGLTYYPWWSKGSLIDGPPPPNGATQALIDAGDKEAIELLGL